MKIRILSAWKQAGDLREREADYLKRLGRYAGIELIEVKGEKGDGKEGLKKEGKRLLSKIGKETLLVALTERGETFGSKTFSRWLEDQALKGMSDLTFVIGSAAGMDEALLDRAEKTLALSQMTYPHQLARLMLIEQIYRAFTIIKGEPYHK